jgi:hypothetical protein
MRKLPMIFILFLGLSCNKDDDPEKFTSFNGYWIVRTPDDATTVTFRISVDADNNPIIDRTSVQHSGADYNSQPIDAELIVTSPTEIESVTFVTGRFVIRLLTLSTNSDFTEMQIANSIFTIDGGFREFSMISATRN